MTKKLLIAFAFTLSAITGYAQNIDLSFVGSFTSGALNGQQVLGAIKINDFGNISGTASPLPGALSDGSDGILESLSFTFFVPAPVSVVPPTEVTFDLSDIGSVAPSASFDGGRLFGFTYFAQDGASSLTAYYDATQTDINRAILFTFNDGTSTSRGTLTLPTGLVPVPEPSAFAAIAGSISLALVVARRRR